MAKKQHGTASALTCDSDLRIKYRFGKYAVRMLEFVDAYEPELLECGAGFRGRRPCGPSSSLEIEIMPGVPDGELEGVVICPEDIDSDRRRAASRSRSLFPPIPRARPSSIQPFWYGSQPECIRNDLLLPSCLQPPRPHPIFVHIERVADPGRISARRRPFPTK